MHPLCCCPWGTESELKPCKGDQSNFLKACGVPRHPDSHLLGFSDLLLGSYWSKTKKTEAKIAHLTWSCSAVANMVIAVIPVMRLLEKKYIQETDAAFISKAQCREELWLPVRIPSSRVSRASLAKPTVGQHFGQFGPLHVWVVWPPEALWNHRVRVGP